MAVMQPKFNNKPAFVRVFCLLQKSGQAMMSQVQVCDDRIPCLFALSAILERTGKEWFIVVIDLLPGDYEIHWDDSGTDSDSPVAIAACYVATKSQWDSFAPNWNNILREEEIDFFHMTDFMAHPKNRVKPYCDWGADKKKRVYERLTGIIRIRVQHGFALTVGKKDYDDLIPQEMKMHYGKDHYGWAVKCLMSEVSAWRTRWGITRPMKYVFSHIPKGKGTRGEILDILEAVREDPKEGINYGVVKDGLSIQDMRLFPPLQAADILAWNMLDHHLNVITKGLDDISDCSPWFKRLREGRPMTLGSLGREQLEGFAKKINNYREQTGVWPSPRVERLFQKAQRRKARDEEKQKRVR